MANVTEQTEEESPSIKHMHGSQSHGSMEDEVDEEEEEVAEDSDTSSESDYEIDVDVRNEMDRIEFILREAGLEFRMIDRIGEGTFSTVYKAQDLEYSYYHNEWDTEAQESSKWISPPVKRRKDESTQISWHGGSQDQRRQKKPRFVAIKKIYQTSSPMRIQNELELLHDLEGCRSVCPLITAIRRQDQVVAVLPHFIHQDFRSFYRRMAVPDIKVYFRSMFEALAAVHKHGIIHRDIKPTNFLYDIHRRRGVLVDFGLAEREGTDWSHCLCQDPQSTRKAKVQGSRAWSQETPIGYPKKDERPSRRANRAGTRGFRAPEVLLKCTAQTSKIDIWSVGVILLTILAQRFPFFNSADDVEAMIEIATIFGKQKMRSCAILHGSMFDCTLSTVGEKGHALAKIVQWSTSDLRPEEGESLDPDVKEAVKFLELLLDLDPRRRISARAALASEFLAEETCETEVDEMDVL